MSKELDLDEVIFWPDGPDKPGVTRRSLLEGEKMMAELGLKTTVNGPEPIISVNLSRDVLKDKEIIREHNMHQDGLRNKIK